MQTRKMLRRSLTVTAVIMSVAATAAENLIPDPQFKKADFLPLKQESSWLWYQIAAPSEAEIDAAAGTVTMKGGKTFLHSSRFKVEQGSAYQVELSAAGDGKVSLEFLWWRDGGGSAEPHRTIPVEPMTVTAEKQKISGTADAPENAGEAYIRIVVEEGNVTISDPNVTAAKQ